MDSWFFEWLQHYAYEPWIVYSAVVVIMFLSSFGLPVPEEVSIISLGLLSYAGSRPDLFPPPSPDSPVIDAFSASLVCSGSIYLSDFTVFSLGKYFGPAVFSSKFVQKFVSKKRYFMVKAWARKWGRVVPAMFRLIPGLRFPGHLMCGAFGIKTSNFLIVDGIVILVIVPTQIFLISHFGEEVLQVMKRFQIVLGILCALFFGFMLWNSIKVLTRKPG